MAFTWTEVKVFVDHILWETPGNRFANDDPEFVAALNPCTDQTLLRLG